MTQDEMKQAVAKAAIDYVEVGTIIGIGTGSTANFFNSAMMLGTSLPGPDGGAYSLHWLATRSELM